MSDPSMDVVERTLTAWVRWDEKPGAIDRAQEMVASVAVLAGGERLTCRRYLARLRRKGCPYRDAVASWQRMFDADE